MPILTVTKLNGKTETINLEKDQMVSVGQHSSSDIIVTDAGVAPLHCRLGWNGKNCLVIATSPEGVDLDGTIVRKGMLKPESVLRVGSMDISLGEETSGEGKPPESTYDLVAIDDDEPNRKKQVASGSVELNPITDDAVDVDAVDTERRSGSSRGKSDESDDDAMSDEMAAEILDDDDDWDLEDLSDEDLAAADASHSNGGSQTPMLSRGDGSDAPPPKGDKKKGEAGDAEENDKKKPKSSLLSSLRSEPTRPGEHDIARSPFVLIMVGGSAALLLTAFTVWFMIFREGSTSMFESARQEMEQGKYAQAIKGFEEFLNEYPRDGRVDEAIRMLGESKILTEISGATPDWAAGVEALKEFIKVNKDRDDFSEYYPRILKYAEQIGLGAAKTAESEKNRDLIQISHEGSKLLQRYSPSDSPPTAKLSEIETARQKADAAILKQETWNQTVATIEEAIKDQKPHNGLAARRKLLAQYAEFESSKELKALLERLLDTESQIVQLEALNKDALTKNAAGTAASTYSLINQQRALSDEDSDGRAIVAVSNGCCYGLDAVTFEPVWRRVIGLDSPFFPIKADAGVSGVLLFDTNRKELIYLNRQSGELVWRQPLGDRPEGPPLIRGGQALVPTQAGDLFLVDVETGRIKERLRFPRRLLAPPVHVATSNQIVLAADREVMYTVSLNPFACRKVTYLGHQPDSLTARLLTMGPYVLVTDTPSPNASRIRVLDASNENERMQVVAESSIKGTVYDAPMIRGNQLIVPSRPETLTAFTVSDVSGKDILTLNSSERIESPVDGEIFFTIGPDNVIWMASSALRMLQLSPDGFYVNPRIAAIGQSTQPIQIVDLNVYAGRKLPASQSVSMLQLDRSALTIKSQTVLGSPILDWTTAGQSSLVAITDVGDIYTISGAEVNSGGFEEKPFRGLPLSETMSKPLIVAELATGQIAVHGQSQNQDDETIPKLWLVNQSGQVAREYQLKGMLDTKPVMIESGVVLPYPGRLSVVPGIFGGLPRVDDYVPAASRERTLRWKHLVRLSGSDLIAVDDNNTIVKVRFSQAGGPHLEAAAAVKLDAPIDVRPAAGGGVVVVADAEQHLRVLDDTGLTQREQIQLPADISNDLWLIGTFLFVETSDDQLHCFNVKPQLSTVWSLPLGKASLAGQPLLQNGKLIVAETDGQVQIVNVATGAVERKAALGQSLSQGPRLMGQSIVVGSIDGTLYRVDNLLQGQP